MMVGSIVKSNAGRDKGELLMVIAVDEPYVLLADGRGRKLEKPKRKKIRHTTPAGFAALKPPEGAGGRYKTENGRELTNRELRGILGRFAASEQEG